MRSLFCLLFLLFGINTMSFAQAFEGQILVQYQEVAPSTTTFTVKGDLAKMERQTTQGLVSIIKDRKTGQKTLLRNRKGKKMAIIQNEKELPKQSTTTSSSWVRAKPVESYRLVEVDSTKIIDDYTCNLIVATNSTTEAKAWVSKDLKLKLTDWFAEASPKDAQEKELEEQLTQRGFVMELTSKNLVDGKLRHRKTIITAKTVDDSAFDIPADYRVNDLTKRDQTVQGFKKSARRLKELQKDGTIKD
ncbi:MAG: DUF4412 domain-containing protein [Bacteroidota bacterium]